MGHSTGTNLNFYSQGITAVDIDRSNAGGMGHELEKRKNDIKHGIDHRSCPILVSFNVRSRS